MYGNYKNVRVSFRMTEREAESYKQGWREEIWKQFTWTELIHCALSYYRDRAEISKAQMSDAVQERLAAVAEQIGVAPFETIDQGVNHKPGKEKQPSDKAAPKRRTKKSKRKGGAK
jgi:hypothetical protein